ncbi:hypothetical protein SAMN04244553_1778 [Nocardia amikacinitolerans]|uniref:Uncharacterized protein n=1 Tax=Nocardia amikacinitolerans TaxID=756689 RepID=A0A285L681_9NOCA|nr:hypothetical protein [Nocardia amikacinitolerans]SNY79963.1 hypothetical protein SAMN04244553_1778 [Nocardia amikacinitolerans]
MDLDLAAVRAFVAVADEGQFGYAASPSSTRRPPIPLRSCGPHANPHPGLPHLVEHVAQNYNRDTATQSWIPDADRPLFMS